MRRGRAAAVAIGLASAAAAASAVAATSGSTVQDRRGDVIGQPPGDRRNYDIVSASHAKLGGGKLKVSVTVAGQFTQPNVPTPELLILVPGESHGTSDCDYYVAPVASGLGVYQCGVSSRRTGTATAQRTGGKTIAYTFSRAAIGNPRSCAWEFRIRRRVHGHVVTLDSVPDWHAFHSWRLQ